jgi:cyclase
MMKSVLVASLVTLLAATAHAQGVPTHPAVAGGQIVLPEAPPGTNFSKIELKTEKLAPHIYILTGSPGADPVHPEAAGGRIGLLEGPDGIVMVDAQYAPVNAKVLAAIKHISSANIRLLIDTHSHLDHTGGNALIAKMGALVIAREETRDALLGPPAGIPAGTPADLVPPRDPARLPNVTLGLGQVVKIYLDGEVIDLIPLPAAHTNGDLMVRFEGADVVMLGDAYRSYGYPLIDPANGGTLKGMVEALDLMLQTAGPQTILVPGHGPIVQRAKVLEQRDMVLAVETRVRDLIAQGRSRAEVLDAKPTASFDAHVPGALDPAVPGGPSSADRFVGSVYDGLLR